MSAVYSPHRCLGPCLALCPEYSFILEDELGVCGCVLGILDVRSFAKRCQASWMPAMRDKYPPKGGNTHPNTQVETWSREIHKHCFYICIKFRISVEGQLTNSVYTSLVVGSLYRLLLMMAKS